MKNQKLNIAIIIILIMAVWLTGCAVSKSKVDKVGDFNFTKELNN